MKNFKLPPKKTDSLQNAINEALAQLSDLSPESPMYAVTMEQIERLYKLQEKHSTKPMSRDTLAIVIGNLAGIVLILGYERANILTSKAIGFVVKPK